MGFIEEPESHAALPESQATESPKERQTRSPRISSTNSGSAAFRSDPSGSRTLPIGTNSYSTDGRELVTNSSSDFGHCERCSSISLDDMLTSDAKDMASEESKSDPGFFLHNLIDLDKCAQAGCRLCRIIFSEAEQLWQYVEADEYWNQLLAVRRGDYLHGKDTLSQSLVYLGLALGSAHIGGTFVVRIGREKSKTRITDLEIEDASQGHLPFSQVGRPCEYDMGSPAALDFMAFAMRRCLEDHPSCRKRTPDLPDLPTRVIDVGDSQTPPHLHIGSPAKGRWVSLSHCWGGQVPYITTKQTLKDRVREILMDDLPATFRDAIVVTRHLGIRYLWIDAICITQDDMDEDWPREASRMRDYYANAILNLTAMNGENSISGILQHRAARYAPLKLRLRSDRFEWEGDVFIRERHPETFSFQGKPFPKLMTRAWVFQEAILAVRSLNFTRSGVVWNCRTHTAPEWLHEPTDYPEVEQVLLQPVSSNDTMGIAEFAEDSTYSNWDEVVRRYSKKALTFSSDKLPALSGIASLFDSMLPEDRYLAGLWEARLEEGLRWAVDPHSRVRSRPAVYRAPSWSWASIDADIVFAQARMRGAFWKPYRARAQVLEAHVEYEPHNPFGRALAGRLRLFGVWRHLYLDEVPSWHRDGPGIFFFAFPEPVGGAPPADPWTRTRWLDIEGPSLVASLGIQPLSPAETESASNSAPHSESGTHDWESEASGWACVLKANLDIPPAEGEFLDRTRQFRMVVLMLFDASFLLLQPAEELNTFRRIGVADASWIHGRRFSDEEVREHSRPIDII